MTPDVVVVGAGPTGLALACGLHRQGVPCRVLDHAPATSRSRAIGISPRSLELLDELGVAAQLVERGMPCRAASFYSRGRRIGRMTFAAVATRYPFTLALPQSETERVLEQRLRQLGGAVERGSELTGLRDEPRGAGVRLRVRGPDGEREVAAEWVVGADGARSAVRRLAGVDFVGEETGETFVNVDADLAGAPLAGEGHYYFAREGMTVVVPLADGFCRVTASLDEPAAARERPLSLDDVQRIVAERLGPAVRIRALRDSGWGVARVHIRTRLATRFRAGRCLLAGDAAHLYGPMGGQGMNGGLQDAQNLAWRLALVATGRAPEGLLDGYDAERRAVARGVLEAVQRQTRLALLRSPIAIGARDAAVRLATRTGLLDRRVAPEVAQFATDYRGMPGIAPARRSDRARRALGRRLPDVPLADADDGARSLFQLLGGRPLTVLVLGARPTDAAALRTLRSRLQARHGDLAALRVLAPAGAAGPRDRDGALHRHLAVAEPTACLVRADAHLAYRGPLNAPDALLAQLERTCGMSPQPAYRG